MKTRWLAVGAGILVTFLWATSYILNKLAFAEGLGPFTLAGLRYAVAALTLLLLRLPGQRRPPAAPALPFRQVLLLGVTGYMMAQGLQYAGQLFVAPTETTLLLAIGNGLLVLVAGAIWLREVPSVLATAGTLAAWGGVALYHYPWDLDRGSWVGMGLIILSSAGYAVNLMLNRHLISQGRAQPRDLVQGPMFIGALGMLLIGLLIEGIPHINGRIALILLWLGPVNGALAFSLWVWSQKTLRAFESSLLNNLVMLQVAALDVLVLNRLLTPLQVTALAITGVSVAVVQAARSR